MDMQVSWSRRAGVLIASPTGRVDSANSMKFREALLASMFESAAAALDGVVQGNTG